MRWLMRARSYLNAQEITFFFVTVSNTYPPTIDAKQKNDELHQMRSRQLINYLMDSEKFNPTIGLPRPRQEPVWNSYNVRATN